MRMETYDADGLAEVATITREAGIPTFRVYRRPAFNMAALTRRATTSESAQLEAREAERAKELAWEVFNTEAGKATPDIKVIATALQTVLAPDQLSSAMGGRVEAATALATRPTLLSRLGRLFRRP